MCDVSNAKKDAWVFIKGSPNPYDNRSIDFIGPDCGREFFGKDSVHCQREIRVEDPYASRLGTNGPVFGSISAVRFKDVAEMKRDLRHKLGARLARRSSEEQGLMKPAQFFLVKKAAPKLQLDVRLMTSLEFKVFQDLFKDRLKRRRESLREEQARPLPPVQPARFLTSGLLKHEW